MKKELSATESAMRMMNSILLIIDIRTLVRKNIRFCSSTPLSVVRYSIYQWIGMILGPAKSEQRQEREDLIEYAATWLPSSSAR